MRAPTPLMLRPAWSSRSSWPVAVSLTDSISRIGVRRCSPAWGVRLRCDGRSTRHTRFGEEPVELGADVALVGDDDQPGSVGGQGGVVVEHGHQDLAFVECGGRSAPG